jgi:hypothetical protein
VKVLGRGIKELKASVRERKRRGWRVKEKVVGSGRRCGRRRQQQGKGSQNQSTQKNITGKTLGATWTSEDMLNLKKYDWRTKLNVNSVNNLIWLTPQFYSPDAESCG